MKTNAFVNCYSMNLVNLKEMVLTFEINFILLCQLEKSWVFYQINLRIFTKDIFEWMARNNMKTNFQPKLFEGSKSPNNSLIRNFHNLEAKIAFQTIELKVLDYNSILRAPKRTITNRYLQRASRQSNQNWASARYGLSLLEQRGQATSNWPLIKQFIIKL